MATTPAAWNITVDSNGNILTITQGNPPSGAIPVPPEINPMMVLPNPDAFMWNGTNIVRKPDTLAQMQTAQNALNYACYLAAIQAPVTYTSKGGVTKQYQADPGSVSALQSTILGFQLAQATLADFYWVALDNTHVPFEYADLLGLAQAMAVPGAAAFAKRQSLKAQVAAAKTVSAVQKIVW